MVTNEPDQWMCSRIQKDSLLRFDDYLFESGITQPSTSKQARRGSVSRRVVGPNPALADGFEKVGVGKNGVNFHFHHFAPRGEYAAHEVFPLLR